MLPHRMYLAVPFALLIVPLATPVTLKAGDRVLVLPVRTQGDVPAQLGDAATQVLAAQLAALGGRVVTLQEISETLTNEKNKQVAACTAESCALEIAGSLDADYLVIGMVSRVGDAFVLALSLVRARNAVVAGRDVARGDARDANAILDEIPPAVQRLFGRAPARPRAAPPPATPTVETPPARATPLKPLLLGLAAPGLVAGVLGLLAAPGLLGGALWVYGGTFETQQVPHLYALPGPPWARVTALLTLSTAALMVALAGAAATTAGAALGIAGAVQ
ncbi:MAG: hypothetical protein HY904_00125 [Deltaproteobacteria bacterium]|nr:hypothetical protein [Deltaproteobacteria bacterium]